MGYIGKYEYVIDRERPSAMSDGRMYKHIIVAESVLGRELLPGEIVHHKDKDPTNNSPENLIVFSSIGEHTRFHNLDCNEEHLEINPDGSFRCRNKINHCVDCGKVVSNHAQRCIDCNAKSSRKSDRPEKEILSEMLFESRGNFSKIGRHFGVTDNAVRKWCTLYGISKKSKDYK